MGTVPYMSPEQVRGLPADARSDIFALGSVLYEMLGAAKGLRWARRHRGDRDRHPPRGAARSCRPSTPHIPVTLDRIVRRCLEKRAEDRFETARDVAFALEAVATATRRAKPTAQGRTRSRRGAAALALPARSSCAAPRRWRCSSPGLRPAPPPPSYTQLTFRRGTILSARFSHDGQTVVYSAAWDGQPAQVYTTRIGSRESRPLGIEGVVLSVSSKDEVAVKLGRFWVATWARASTRWERWPACRSQAVRLGRCSRT